jgi:hypothetical protein
MSTFHFQPEIRPQPTLGTSPFRVELPELFITSLETDRRTAGPLSAPFSPIAAENLWTNQPSRSHQERRRRAFPVVKASGRAITQSEIDDALED